MNDLPLSHIVAVGHREAIGLHGKMPWHLPTDLKRFAKLTANKPMIVGRKTWESMGGPLKDNRPVIVVTRNANYGAGEDECPCDWTATSIQAAYEAAEKYRVDMGADEIMIAGGGQIYRETIKDTKRIYLTAVMYFGAGGECIMDDEHISYPIYFEYTRAWKVISAFKGLTDDQMKEKGDSHMSYFSVLERGEI